MQQAVIYIYFISLIVVGLFSLEALYLAYIYWRRKKILVPPEADSWTPMVTVQLPVFNELYVVERLIRSVCELDYPKDKLHIQVLDDSTDQTTAICRHQIAFYRDQGFLIDHINREDRSGFKAGALKNGLQTARGDLIAVFDADFLPLPDFLKRTVLYFRNQAVGMVQTRWEHLNENFSMITRAQAFGLAGHFVIEQNGRNSAGYFINFNGTAGVWRKSCILDAGNWQSDTLTEDLDLSYRAQMKGWKFIFVDDIATPSELPAEINALKSQQYRWTKGAIETARKLLPKLWRSHQPLRLKIHATFHLTNNIVYPFILLLALLNLPLILIKKTYPESAVYFVIFSFFTISFLASFTFYLLSQKSLHPDWQKRMFLFPLFMSGSMGFSINNTKAVIQGLLKKSSPFIRTPKYNLSDRSESFSGKIYRLSLDKMVFFELAMAIYSSFGLVVAVYYQELGLLPFMLMFSVGFTMIGFLSIKHHITQKYRRA